MDFDFGTSDISPTLQPYKDGPMSPEPPVSALIEPVPLKPAVVEPLSTVPTMEEPVSVVPDVKPVSAQNVITNDLSLDFGISDLSLNQQPYKGGASSPEPVVLAQVEPLPVVPAADEPLLVMAGEPEPVLSDVIKPVPLVPPMDEPNPAQPLLSVYAIKNGRRKMEDRHVIIHDLNKETGLQSSKQYSYYAIFDGHAGADAAEFAADRLHKLLAESHWFNEDLAYAIKQAYETTDNEYLAKSIATNTKAGCTAITVLLERDPATGSGALYFGWLGDSQAVLVRNGVSEEMTPPHKPEHAAERQRIEDAGGIVMCMDTWRVSGTLAVSRAIGDPDHKPYVTSTPDVKRVPLTGEEDYVVIACDGLWDNVTPDEVSTIVYEALASADESQLDQATDSVSKELSNKAVNDGSSDNITVITLFLKDPVQLRATPVPTPGNISGYWTAGSQNQDHSGSETFETPLKVQPEVSNGHYPFELQTSPLMASTEPAASMARNYHHPAMDFDFGASDLSPTQQHKDSPIRPEPVISAPIEPVVRDVDEPVPLVPAADDSSSALLATDEPVPVVPAVDEPVLLVHAADEPVPAFLAFDEERPVVTSADEPAPASPAFDEPVPVVPAADEPSLVVPVTGEPSPIVPATDEPSPVVPATDEPSPVVPAADEPVPVTPAVEKVQQQQVTIHDLECDFGTKELSPSLQLHKDIPLESDVSTDHLQAESSTGFDRSDSPNDAFNMATPVRNDTTADATTKSNETATNTIGAIKSAATVNKPPTTTTVTPKSVPRTRPAPTKTATIPGATKTNGAIKTNGASTTTTAASKPSVLKARLAPARTAKATENVTKTNGTSTNATAVPKSVPRTRPTPVRTATTAAAATKTNGTSTTATTAAKPSALRPRPAPVRTAPKAATSSAAKPTTTNGSASTRPAMTRTTLANRSASALPSATARSAAASTASKTATTSVKPNGTAKAPIAASSAASRVAAAREAAKKAQAEALVKSKAAAAKRIVTGGGAVKIAKQSTTN